MEENESIDRAPASRPPGKRLLRATLVLVTVALGASVFGLVRRSESATNQVALSASPKLVTVVAARAASFRPSRSYVGTLAAWVEAKLGPQFVSAYVDTVLVRPGDAVKKGQVLATLDCRSASAARQAITLQAQALEAQQRAQASEAARYGGMLKEGFASANEVEMKSAASAAQAAELGATRARLLGSGLEVSDCVLRAPFDGEVLTRTSDPGAFVRPGMPLVTVVDRHTARFAAEVPEADFDAVAVGRVVRIHLTATGRDVTAPIARRSPGADPGTRTVHFEVDIPDPLREIPVDTTGEVRIDFGQPLASLEVPLPAATVRGLKATLFVVEGGTAHARTLTVVGESGGRLFVTGPIAPGALVVAEGRALLNDGDPVTPKTLPDAAPAASGGAP